MLWSEKFGDELLRWLAAKDKMVVWGWLYWVGYIDMVVLRWLY
jgi:hypothetical protein